MAIATAILTCNFEQRDCLEVPCVQEMLVISPDKPGGTKRRLTNTGVNIRPSGALHGPHCLSRDFTWSYSYVSYLASYLLQKLIYSIAI